MDNKWNKGRKRIVATFLPAMLALLMINSIPVRTVAADAYGSALLQYFKQNTDILNEPYVLSMASGAELAEFFPRYCFSDQLDEFAIHQNMPKWLSSLRSQSQGVHDATIMFDVGTGIYSFSRHALPIDAGGGFKISASSPGGSCGIPPYDNLPSVPEYAEYLVEPGVVPSNISVVPDVARSIVDANRSVRVKLGVRINDVELADYELTVHSTPLWIVITAQQHVLFKRKF